MTKQQHTPGPWTLETVTTKAGRNKLALGGKDGRICDITIYDKTQNANARVMRAAPELLESLRDTTIWLRAALNCEAWAWDIDQRECAQGVLDSAEAAIAKAEGC